MSDNSENRFRRAVKADPNELCPCGSGQLYKDCHGRFVDIIKEKKYSGAVSADGMAIAVLEYLDKATDWSAAKEIRSIGRAGDNEAALAYALYLLLRREELVLQLLDKVRYDKLVHQSRKGRIPPGCHKRSGTDRARRIRTHRGTGDRTHGARAAGGSCRNSCTRKNRAAPC